MKPEESFVGQPIRALQTMLRTIARVDDRQADVIPDGVYTKQTADAVASFQRRSGLPVTGVADGETWRRISEEAYPLAKIETEPAQPMQITLNPNQVIRRGEENPHLYVIQAMLYLMSEMNDGIPEPVISGVLDEETALALQAFQLLSGLPASGELDKRTWKYLALQYSRAADQMENEK